jgi:hypothetical protein
MVENAPYIGIDLGGTGFRVYEVNPSTGKLLKNYSPDIELKDVKSNEHLTDIIRKSLPTGKRLNIGTTSSGAINKYSLIVKGSPNLPIKGEITFARDLREDGNDVAIDNDINVALMGAVIYGQARGLSNVLMATYSSGFNCAKSVDEVVTTEAEFGHMPYQRGAGIFCGCGGVDHLETHISGNGAAARAKEYFIMTNQKSHPILDKALNDLNTREGTSYDPNDLKNNNELRNQVIMSITAKHIYQTFKEDPESNPQKSIQKHQVEAIADSLGMMFAANRPLELMILMGSQAEKDWPTLFKPALDLIEENPENYSLPFLTFPKVVKSELEEAGVVGSVANLIQQQSG